MNAIEKFYNDAESIFAKEKNGIEALQNYFIRSTKKACPEATLLIEDFATLLQNDPNDYAVRHALLLFALLTNNFDETMDFSDSDWAYIRESVALTANDIDFSLVSDIMSILVRRKKI